MMINLADIKERCQTRKDGPADVRALIAEVERLSAENRRLHDLATVLSDLDRCEHGRHEGDVCSGASGCNGPSHGNPFGTGRRIGTGLSRQPIRIPERGKGYMAEDWYVA